MGPLVENSNPIQHQSLVGTEQASISARCAEWRLYKDPSFTIKIAFAAQRALKGNINCDLKKLSLPS